MQMSHQHQNIHPGQATSQQQHQHQSTAPHLHGQLLPINTQQQHMMNHQQQQQQSHMNMSQQHALSSSHNANIAHQSMMNLPMAQQPHYMNQQFMLLEQAQRHSLAFVITRNPVGIVTGIASSSLAPTPIGLGEEKAFWG
ncbi:hypothetical protein ZHAS_00007111 [Anopheles sinensis]|uniref:Uncharacterized protein n=1 Tax=Anopheles sinensis TaxID=74873 RepID=A0A084VNW8_ANOSI|nr:hypothetical protein ZHAS_00007111 [Anopheles sinensis]